MTERRSLLAGFAAAALALTLTVDADARTRKKPAPVDPAITAVQQLDAETAAALDAAIAGAHRSDTNKARDQYRNPKQTLAFFGLTTSAKVLEVNPGGGWYTEVLAPTLREKGQLYVTGGNPNGPGRQGLSNLLGKFAKDPKVYDKVQFTGSWQAEANRIQPGSLDMVVTFRNVHNFVYNKQAEQLFKDWYAFLKPGGVLGIEEHRWPEGVPNTIKPPNGAAGNGYMTESEVIALATAAGFKLAAKSEINANPKDPRDHAAGVWALPPTLANGETDRAKYLAIGESDRMTLKFVKPAV